MRKGIILAGGTGTRLHPVTYAVSKQLLPVEPTRLPEVMLIKPRVFGDARGFFFESWNEQQFMRAGIAACFVQDNHSRSSRHTLRGCRTHPIHPIPPARLHRIIW